MKPPKPTQSITTTVAAGLDGLVHDLRALIAESRQQALRAVDVVQVRTCWGVGQHIGEFEQGGAARAEYGSRLLPRLAEMLTAEFGRGFDASNLRYMRLFYLAFPIRDALRHELSWTHYRSLLRIEDSKAREWYLTEAATQNWSSRALDRQIGRLYYERLLASKDKAAVTAEAVEKIAEMKISPRDFVRDPVLHEHEQLFASRYRLILPTEEELLQELIREQQLLEERKEKSPLKPAKKGGCKRVTEESSVTAATATNP